MTNRHTRSMRDAGNMLACAVTIAMVTLVAVAGLLAAGCGGEGNLGYKGAPLIFPETANLAPGGSTTFYPGVLEVDQHKKTEGFHIQEKDGGSFVVDSTDIDYEPPAVVYTAPTKLGTYHIQWVWDEGTKNEKTATATITVTNTPPYTPLDPNAGTIATPSP